MLKSFTTTLIIGTALFASSIAAKAAPPNWVLIDSDSKLYVDSSSIKRGFIPKLHDSASATFSYQRINELYPNLEERIQETHTYDCKTRASLEPDGEVRNFSSALLGKQLGKQEELKKKIFDYLCPNSENPWIRIFDYTQSEGSLFINKYFTNINSKKSNPILEILTVKLESSYTKFPGRPQPIKYWEASYMVYQFDCKEKQLRTTGSSYFDKSEWAYQQPETAGSLLLELACTNKFRVPSETVILPRLAKDF
jgi:hypothetical protein